MDLRLQSWTQRHMTSSSVMIMALALLVMLLGRTPAHAEAPLNDSVENATPITVPSTTFFDLREATADPSDPEIAPGVTAVRTVWLTYTPTVTDTHGLNWYTGAVGEWYYWGGLAVFAVGSDGSLTRVNSQGENPQYYHEVIYSFAAGQRYLFMFYMTEAADGDVAYLMMRVIPGLVLQGSITSARLLKGTNTVEVTGRATCNVDAEVSVRLSVVQTRGKRSVSAAGELPYLHCPPGETTIWTVLAYGGSDLSFKRKVDVSINGLISGYEYVLYDRDEVSVEATLPLA